MAVQPPRLQPPKPGPLVWSPTDPAARWLSAQRERRHQRARLAILFFFIGAAVGLVVLTTWPQLTRPPLHLSPALAAGLAVALLLAAGSLIEAVCSRLTFQAPSWNPLTWSIGRRWYRPGQYVHHRGQLAVTADWMRQEEHGEQIWVFVLLFDDDTEPIEDRQPYGWWLPIGELAPAGY